MQLITGSCGGERCINMAVTLREIIKQVQHLEMKLVAGERQDWIMKCHGRIW